LSVLSKEKRDISYQISAIRKQEKRDDNTPTRSGQAPFTEGRTQRSQRWEKKGEEVEECKSAKARVLRSAEIVPRSLHSAARHATIRRGREGRAAAVGMTFPVMAHGWSAHARKKLQASKA